MPYKALQQSSLGAGIATGTAQAAERERARPEREARLQEAQMRQKMMQSQFEDYQEDAPVREQEREQRIAELEAGTYKAQADGLRDRTFDAFHRYEADGDVRHLNQFLRDAKNNAIGQNLYSDIVTVEAIGDTNFKEAVSLAREAGLDEPETLLNDKEAKKDLVIGIDPNGDRMLIQMSQLYASEGFSEHMSNKELEEAERRAKLIQMSRGGADSTEWRIVSQLVEEEGMTLSEAVEFYHTSKRSTRKSAIERIADELRKENPDMDEAQLMRTAGNLYRGQGSETEREAYQMSISEGIPYNVALDRVQERKERTTSQRNLAQADDVRNKLDELGGGDFFELDLSDQANRRKASRFITELENLTGSKLSTEDQRTARSIRELSNLGAIAGEDLTPQETGLVDNLLFRFKRYVSDSVEGGRGVAAYETFRNVIRNALYGSALTGNEIKAFDRAAGSLKQQAGPVLQQLQLQMESIKDQLQSIYDLNDEYIAHYYLGQDLSSIDRAIEAIDQRIDEVSRREQNRGMPDRTLTRPDRNEVTDPEQQQQTLQSIWGDS